MPRNVSEVLVQQLGDWGVRHVFGVMGETILGLLNAIRRQDRVRFLATRHEGAAALAASAYGKLTGEPAACIAMGGPGATNLTTGLYDAQADRAALVAITGQVRRPWRHEGAWQEMDAQALFEPVSVFNAEVQTPAQAPLLLADALHAAVSRRGVAHLAVPLDIQQMEADVDPIRPEGHLSWSEVVASDEAIRRAARLLAGASRPLILAGWGAQGAREPLLHLAHRLGAPVLTTCRAKGLAAGDPLAMGIPGYFGTPLGDELVREADTILVVGASLSQNTTGNWQLIHPQQQLIQIDIDPAQIGRLFAVEVGLWGDAAATVRRIVSALAEGQPHTSWGDLGRRRAEFEARVDRKAAAETTPIKPQFVVRTLQETLSADAVIALDAGDHAYFVCQQYAPKGERFVMSYHLGSTGFGLPGAIAAAVAYPRRQAVAVVGDGGLASTLGELVTLAEHELPVTVVCFNNARLGMLNSQEERLGLTPFFTELLQVDLSGVARASGVAATRVEAPGALAGALKEALEAPRPFLVDVAVDPEERESTALEPLGAAVPA